MIKRLVITGFIALGALFVLALVAWATLPYFLSTDVARAAIEKRLSQLFAQPVHLNGPTELRLTPRPRVVLNDLRVAKSADAEPPFIRATQLQADINVAALIGGDIAFGAFRLIEPVFSVAVARNGRWEWPVEALIRSRMSAPDMPTDAVEIARKRKEIMFSAMPKNLGIVDIVDGMLELTGNAHGSQLPTSIENMNAKLRWPSRDSRLAIAGSAQMRGEDINFSLTIASMRALMSPEATQVDFNLQSRPVNVRFSGISSSYDPVFADGEMAFTSPSVQELVTWLGINAEPGRSLGAVTLSGPMAFKAGRSQFAKLALNVDGSQGTGVLEISRREEGVFSVGGTLDFASLDTQAFVAAFLRNTRQGSARNGSAAFFKSDLRVSAREATFGKLAMRDLAMTAQTGAQMALFDIADATAMGGNVQARLQVDAADAAKPSQINVTLTAQGVDFAAVREAFSLPLLSPTGIGDVTLTAKSQMGSTASIIENANGALSLKLVNGAIAGLGMQQLMQSDGLANYFPVSDGASVSETFLEFTTQANLVSGLLYLNDSTATYPTGSVKLNGVVAGGSGSLAVTATAQTTDSTVRKQFFVGGTMNRPFATPVLNSQVPVVEE